MNWLFPVVRVGLKTTGWGFWSGSAAALLVAGLQLLKVWTPLEQAAYGPLFRLRGPQSWHSDLVLITIDDATLQQLGQFPLNRKYYAELIDRLTPAKPAVIVFNLVFADPGTGDAALAAAIARQGHVVLAQAWTDSGQPLLPLPQFDQGAIATGHILNRPDSDGMTRRVQPLEQGVPTLSIAALQSYDLVKKPVPLPDLNQPLWLNWTGPRNQAPQYSMIDILNGQVSPAAFEGKLVLVGSSITGLDSIPTPFDPSPPATGVYLHATLLNNLLQQNLLRVSPPGAIALILVLGGPVLGVLLSQLRWYQRLLLLTGLTILWVGGVAVSFQSNLWLPVALPLGLVAMTAALVEAADRLRLDVALQRELQRLQQLSLRQSPDSLGPLEPSLPEVSSLPTLRNLTALAEQFAQSQAVHAAIARDLSVGILAAGAEGGVWFFNPMMAEWLAVQVGDRLEALLVPQWLSPETWQQMQHKLQSGQVEVQEVRRGDRWFLLKLDPLSAAPGGLLLTLEEITDLKQTAGEIYRDLAHEREMSQLKTRFISMISHELRTPLTIIQSTADLLEYYDWSPSDKQERFERIREAVFHMTQLLEDVLLIGKSEAGTLQLRPQAIDLSQFCENLITTFGLTLGCDRQMHFRKGGVPQEAWLDAKLLRQILDNLLSNAIKYSHPGSSVTLELLYRNPWVQFRIKDQGIGIPLPDQEKLFSAFYRATNVNQIQGTGLGLMIVKKCVDLLQGRITFESEPGLGTTFIVTLPLQVQEQEAG